MRIGNEYAAKTLCKAVQACYNFSVYTEDGTNETTGRSCMENKLIRSKYFLYLTEFFAGMSVMAVELGASRLMAPYFSSSQIVWTVIIGVIMIAMAIGNVWGGKLADKSATPDKLYRRLIIAAIWIALIPFVGRYLIAGISLLLALFVTKNFLVWAALAACLVIFAFPCVLLGTVTPSLTRFTVDTLDDTGKTVGRLNALNTIGSIIGTFVPTFVTIPAVGTAATFLIFSGVLAAIGIAYFVFEKKKSVPGIVSILLIAGLCFALPSYSFAFWQSDITLEDESIYNYLQVQDDAKRTTLSTNVLFGVQSVQVKGDALTGMYYDYALAAPCMAGMDGTDNENRSVMILGMGSGTYASYCTRYFPGASVQGAEIDKKIADIATDYFGLPGSVTVAVEDGRAYLAASEEKFDVIMVDAYQDITIPFQLSSVEFFNEVRSHLKPNGVMVVNLNMTSAENGSINEYLCDTMASVFKYTVTAPVKGNTNTEVFCTNSGDWEETFLRSIANLKDNGKGLVDCLGSTLGNRRHEIGIGGPTGKLNAFGTTLTLQNSLREVLPNLVGGERKDGRENAHHNLKNVHHDGLSSTTCHGIRSVGIQAVLACLHVNSRKVVDNEIVNSAVHVMETIILISLLNVAQKFLGLHHHPLIDRGKGVPVGYGILGVVEVVDVGKQEAERVAETTIRASDLVNFLSRKTPRVSC